MSNPRRNPLEAHAGKVLLVGVVIQAALFAAAQMHDPGPMAGGIYVTPGERVEMLLAAAYTINFLVFAALVGAGYTLRRRAERDGGEAG